MRIQRGFLDQLELGTDKESGKRNIFVSSGSEYASLPDERQKVAWTTIYIAGEILDTTVQGIYYRIYKKGLPAKTFKRNVAELKGLTLVRPYGWVADKKAKRASDQRTLGMRLRKALGRFTWLPKGQGERIALIVSTELRAIEEELFGKGEEGHETSITA